MQKHHVSESVNTFSKQIRNRDLGTHVVDTKSIEFSAIFNSKLYIDKTDFYYHISCNILWNDLSRVPSYCQTSVYDTLTGTRFLSLAKVLLILWVLFQQISVTQQGFFHPIFCSYLWPVKVFVTAPCIFN